jgi:hypothetical protein
MLASGVLHVRVFPLTVAASNAVSAATAIVPTQFHCDPTASVCPSIMVPTVNGFVSTLTTDYVHDFFGFNYDERWIFTLTTAMFAVGYRLLTMLATRYISHLKR